MVITEYYRYSGTDIIATLSGTRTTAESCCAEANCKPGEQVDELKPNMNFYQTKMHRRKKGGRVSFK